MMSPSSTILMVLLMIVCEANQEAFHMSTSNHQALAESWAKGELNGSLLNRWSATSMALFMLPLVLFIVGCVLLVAAMWLQEELSYEKHGEIDPCVYMEQEVQLLGECETREYVAFANERECPINMQYKTIMDSLTDIKHSEITYKVNPAGRPSSIKTTVVWSSCDKFVEELTPSAGKTGKNREDDWPERKAK